jgi:hypothetical protein
VYTSVVDREDLARRFVFLSGGAVTAAARQFVATVPNRLLEKPASIELLHEVIQELVESETPS